ncbi:hypothetical protein JVU11DRAFT_5913 [Chiua virens]|nr:hypothetical protein JVU11DRAFT_5913 [Chiua virens]
MPLTAAAAATGTLPLVPCARVPLTEGARKVVNEHRRQAMVFYQQDLENTWDKIDQSIADIAMIHRKTVGCVQREFYMGQSMLGMLDATGSDILVDMIQHRKPEYLALTEEQKQELVANYIPLSALRARTSLESTLCAVRGSMDMTLHPIHFETQGLIGFLGNGVRIDRQDLTTRMEGYSVQGVRGQITGDESVQMRYKDYWSKIVQHYKVQIEGWPSNITFTNFSDTSLSLSDIELLSGKWRSGIIYWHKLTDEEYARLKDDRNAQIDCGMRRRSYRWHNNASNAVIESSDDENSNSKTTNGNNTSGLSSSVMSPTPNSPSPPRIRSPIPGSSGNCGTAAAPSNATATAGAGNMFNDLLNTTNELDFTFPEFNNPNLSFFNFDFGDGTYAH